MADAPWKPSMSPSPSISAVVDVTDSSSHSENGTGDKSASASASGPGGDDAVYVSLTESRVLLAEQLKLKQELAELREALALAHRSIANAREDKNNLERRYQEEVRSVQQALDITKRQVDAESRARHELQKHVTMLAEPMDGRGRRKWRVARQQREKCTAKHKLALWRALARKRRRNAWREPVTQQQRSRPAAARAARKRAKRA